LDLLSADLGLKPPGWVTAPLRGWEKGKEARVEVAEEMLRRVRPFQGRSSVWIDYRGWRRCASDPRLRSVIPAG